MTNKIPVHTYTPNDSFYGRLHLLITVKSFDLQAIRKRYLASRKSNKSGKAGSVERRKPGLGGIVAVTIDKGKIIEQNVICKLKEPRGIDRQADRLGIAAENKLYIFEGDRRYEVEHDWFSYIHTLQFSPFDPSRVLVASSGLDCIFEVDYKTGAITFEWVAWEHGFNEAHDPETNAPIYLTRKPIEADRYARANTPHLLITDPASQSLPTAKRAAFINSISYVEKDENSILGTFFHEGAVFRIDRASGKAVKVLDGLKNPHGGKPLNGDYLATSTATGEVVIGGLEQKTVYDFNGLEGKPSELARLEWLQNSVTTDGLFITIDSNRNAFFIFQPEEKLISKVDYDLDWAIQDIIVFAPSPETKEALKTLHDPAD